MQLSRRDALLSLAAGVAVSTQPAAAGKPTSASYPGPRTIAHRTLSANGIDIHIAEQGEGLLVLLLHGFPQNWYAWRYQIPELAGAGYHVVAPDMRGYGDTTAPPERESYSILHTVGDVVGLVAALGASRAVVVGHDWGANVAWNAALLRPDLFVAVAALSVPFRPRTPAPPLRTLRRAGFDTHYWIYYQDPGVAEAEFERDPKDTLRRIYTSAAGDSPVNGDVRFILQPGKGFLDSMPEPQRLPA